MVTVESLLAVIELCREDLCDFVGVVGTSFESESPVALEEGTVEDALLELCAAFESPEGPDAIKPTVSPFALVTVDSKRTLPELAVAATAPTSGASVGSDGAMIAPGATPAPSPRSRCLLAGPTTGVTRATGAERADDGRGEIFGLSWSGGAV